MMLYMGSSKPLPIVRAWDVPKEVYSSPTWPREAQRFHTKALEQSEEIVRSHFSLPHIVYAGSYEGCGCGFSYGREFEESEDDLDHLTAARESVAELVRYIQDSKAGEIYSCWSDDLGKPTVYERAVTPRMIAAYDFVFRERELLKIKHDDD